MIEFTLDKHKFDALFSHGVFNDENQLLDSIAKVTINLAKNLSLESIKAEPEIKEILEPLFLVGGMPSPSSMVHQYSIDNQLFDVYLPVYLESTNLIQAIQSLLLFFIDGASKIDPFDSNWNCLLIYSNGIPF